MKFAKDEDPLYDKLRSDGGKLFLVILIIKPYLTMENILVQMTYHHKAMIGLFFLQKSPYVPKKGDLFFVCTRMKDLRELALTLSLAHVLFCFAKQHVKLWGIIISIA